MSSYFLNQNLSSIMYMNRGLMQRIQNTIEVICSAVCVRKLFCTVFFCFQLFSLDFKIAKGVGHEQD